MWSWTYTNSPFFKQHRTAKKKNRKSNLSFKYITLVVKKNKKITFPTITGTPNNSAENVIDF